MEKKREILSKLLVSEEETLGELEELVTMASRLLRIEKETGESFFTTPKDLTNKDKIALLLVGKYFAKELGLKTDTAFSTGELSEKLNVPSTTLSKPLGQLVEEKIIRKTDDGKYIIVYHKIKGLLESKSGKNG